MQTCLAPNRSWCVGLGLGVLGHPLLKPRTREYPTVIIIRGVVLRICREVPCIWVLVLLLMMHLILAPSLATQHYFASVGCLILSRSPISVALAQALISASLATVSVEILLTHDIYGTLAVIVQSVVLAGSNGRKVVTRDSDSLHVVVELSELAPKGPHVRLLCLSARQGVAYKLFCILVGLPLVSGDHRSVESLSLLLALSICISTIRIFHNFVHKIFVKCCSHMLLVLPYSAWALAPILTDSTDLLSTHCFLASPIDSNLR